MFVAASLARDSADHTGAGRPIVALDILARVSFENLRPFSEADILARASADGILPGRPITALDIFARVSAECGFLGLILAEALILARVSGVLTFPMFPARILAID